MFPANLKKIVIKYNHYFYLLLSCIFTRETPTYKNYVETPFSLSLLAFLDKMATNCFEGSTQFVLAMRKFSWNYG